jgi:hypothetical protein
MKLTIDIQTRGRPTNVHKVLDTLIPNLALDNTTVLVTCDSDDGPSVSEADAWTGKDPRVLVSVAPREDTRGLKFDRALTLAPADVYMPAADTVLIHRKGFDAAILEASKQFEDGIGCVYSPLVNASFPGFQCPTSKLVEKLGYIYPRQFPFWFIDHWLDDVVRMIDRFIVVDVEADHNSLRNQSKTHGCRDLKFWCDYYDAMASERQAEALRIINDPEFMETPERKAALVFNFWPIQYRSMGINEFVRSQEAAIMASRGDASEPPAAYRAVKARAEAQMMKEAA